MVLIHGADTMLGHQRWKCTVGMTDVFCVGINAIMTGDVA